MWFLWKYAQSAYNLRSYIQYIYPKDANIILNLTGGKIFFELNGINVLVQRTRQIINYLYSNKSLKFFLWIFIHFGKSILYLNQRCTLEANMWQIVFTIDCKDIIFLVLHQSSCYHNRNNLFLLNQQCLYEAMQVFLCFFFKLFLLFVTQ